MPDSVKDRAREAARGPRTARRRTGRVRLPSPPRSSIRWDRVARKALIAVLVAILCLYVKPVVSWISQRSTASQYNAELEQLERENAELRGRLDTLRRPDAIESEARELGMVRRGERPYVIQNLP